MTAAPRSALTRLTVLSLSLAAAVVVGATIRAAGSQARSAVTTATAPGLKQPVDILVDRWGVPHIFAASEDDAFFAQGYNAARERLFQIDLWRRRGLGQLAEIYGPSFVEQDRASRLFLYRGDMDREWRAYSSHGTNEAQRIAAAFVAGINAYVDGVTADSARLPWEFKALGYMPAKWAAEDVVRIRSHGLTRNLTSEIARADIACRADLGADEIRVGLQPSWRTQVPDGLDPCLPRDVLKVFTLATQTVVEPRPPQSAATRTQAATVDVGSNNWVIAPSKSATGRAILANDPHRAYSVPSLRYIAHLSAPGLNVIGAGEPALPGISIGHNGTIAFGFTIFNIDQEDLYVYDLNPANATEYRYRDGWEAMRVIRERIAVKGGEPADAELRFTRHGPVIFVDSEKNRAYAVRSAWFEPGMAPYFGSIDYMRAKNFAQFKRSMLMWGAPTENLVYADASGNIGWAPGGLAPKRSNWDGLMPVPGDGRYEWTGRWTGDDLPSVYNPSQGYFATANQMNLPSDYPYTERKLGFEWTNDSRFRRVSEVLGALPKVSIDDSMRLQNDIVSIPARRLVALLSRLSSADPKTRAALTILRGWDALERVDSPKAALFEVWLAHHLGPAFVNAVLPHATAQLIPSPDMAVMLAALEQPAPRFGENVASAADQRDRLLLSSLAGAYSEMERLQGADAAAWQWGRLHHNTLVHPLTALVDDATRARINVGPLPKSGGPYTPNQSTYRETDFRHTSGPSFRIVVDVGRWDESRAMNYPGQSGNPDSPHYRDLASSWLSGEYFPLLYSRSAIEAAAETRIRLVPR